MRTFAGTKLVCLAMAVACAAWGFAGALEDARAALKGKQYDRVDAILEKVLAQKQPPAEALRVSLDAARASGRYLTAQKRITAILRATQTPELFYQGAEIADSVGDTNLALARYLTFAKRTRTKDGKLKAALLYLCRHNTYPDEYQRLVDEFGADETAWALGRRLFDQLLQAGDQEKAIDTARFLIAKFPRPAQVGEVHRLLKTASDRRRLRGDDRERYLRPLLAMTKGTPDELSSVAHFFGAASRVMPAEQRVSVAFAVQSQAKGPLPHGMCSHFHAMRSLTTDGAKLAAGRKFLAHEPLYRASKNPGDYDAFLSVIDQAPQVFHINGNALVSAAEMQKKFDVLAAMPGLRSDVANRHIQNIQRQWLGKDQAAQVRFLRKHIRVLDPSRLGDLLRLVKGQGLDSLLAEAAKGRSYGKGVDLRAAALAWYHQAKRKDKLLAVAREYMSAYPGSFDWRRVRQYVIDSPVVDLDSKVGLLGEIAGKAGQSPALRDLVRGLTRDRRSPQWRTWRDHPGFQQLTRDLNRRDGGSDPLMRTHAALHGIRLSPNRPRPDAQRLCEQLLGAYKRPIPGGSAQTRSLQDVLAYGIFRRHYDHVHQSRKGVYAWAELWAPRLALGPAWAMVADAAKRHQGGLTLYHIAPHYIALCKGKEKGDPAVWAALAYATNPRGDAKSLFAAAYAKMGAASALDYLSRQENAMTYKQMMDEMAKVAAAPGLRITDPGLATRLIASLYYRAGPRSKPPVSVSKALWACYLADAARTRRYSPTTEACAYGHYAKAGRAAEADKHLSRYLGDLKKRTVPRQLAALGHLYPSLPREDKRELKPRHRLHTLLRVLAPLYHKTKPSDWLVHTVHSSVLDDVREIATTWPDGEAKQQAVGLLRRQVDMLLGGARHVGSAASLFPLVERRLDETIAKGEWLAVGRLARYYAAILRYERDWARNYRDRVQPLVKKLQAKGAHELAYIFLAEVERRNRPSEKVGKQIALLKSKAATEIPGLRAVAKSDPAYDLHLAAEALALGSETKAWQLTAPKLRRLPAAWLRLDADYVAWCVEQMRKQKLLKQGLELAFTILLREVDLDPEIAARVSLTKGDIYRDMQNYQAAKIEYEGLKNNRRYNRTKAGLEARYRLVDLLILTKDYASAEGLLDALVNSDDLRTQAEAHFLYARIAFDQADYPQAKDCLKEVFKRKHDHVEARLLEGELKLLLPRGLASTEVLVGNPKLRTVAIPGRPLTLKLHDANLSVARGGAAIPVVVTTSKGGDTEKVKLIPSASDKNLFQGTITTALGKVEKNNVRLELRGDDVVSYVIEPAFQKANDLDYPPKRLDVKADARLVASAGEILTEEEAEKRTLERRLRAARGEFASRRSEGRSGTTVRPGSPIYVQVTDFDRDVGDRPDKLPVTLKTSSGDLVEGFALTETGPHTGVFRGAAPTGIPFPKASASDSEEGKDPSAMINSTKGGLWVSLGDGQMPKWVEVDTMSSHAVKSCSVEMPDRAKVRQVVLMGMLADGYEFVASHPKGLRGSGRGLHGEYYNGRNFARRRLVRVDPKIDFDFARRRPHRSLGGENLSVRWTGQVMPRFSETYTFYTNSDDGVRLWVDGKKLIENWSDHATAEDKGTVKLKAGQRYDIKLEYYQGNGDAAIQLLWSSKSQKKQIVPTGQLYAAGADAKPIEPLGTIAPTAAGFTATLDQPKRLRKLKWVFEEFDGKAIAVKQITVKDAKGKTVIPVKVDFTTATTNQTLEISPGDTIEVAYADDKRTRDDTPVLTATLDSSYYNGEVMLANEVVEDREGGGRTIRYEPARRCRVGDQLMVVLTDYDEDLSDKRDSVAIQVATSRGERLELKSLETWVNDTSGDRHKHSGVFLAVLRTGKQAAKDAIKLQPGDTITVSYLDKENTDPGIPVDRTCVVSEAGKSTPQLTAYRTSVKLVEDKTQAAQAKIRQMRMRGKKTEGMVIYTEQITALHTAYEPEGAEPPKPPAPKPKPAKAKEEVAVSVNAPLLFEVTYPRVALNAGSILEVSAVAESELRAAAKAKREPKPVKVPMYIKPIDQLARDKGYRITLVAADRPREGEPRLPGSRRTAEEMLDEGSFAGVVRLQIGSPGDPIDNLVLAGGREFERPREGPEDTYRLRVPTLLVAGSDVVHIRVKDIATGKTVDTRLRLLSDARLELLDSSYTARKEAIHLGEKFHLRLTDPDRDATDQQDKVAVKVKAASGDTLALELKETLPHSGVFTGSLKPAFIGGKVGGKPPKADPADKALSVSFGDEVAFNYTDATSLASDKPVDVAVQAKVHFGSDSELAGFSKRFKDPEMAVKTRFLMAEALFEMAKEHRKLGQGKLAGQEIARGKGILEEAMRDYPNTSLVAQGEFLLANLAQELGKNQEAIGRYSNIISNWPDGEYAPRSQFKKAICLEKMENYGQACEEYVKLTYIYPDSHLVADATVRLGNYYYKQKNYKVAGRVFFKFQQRNPTHRLAVKTLFLSGECYMKLEDYKESIKLFKLLVDRYIHEKTIRPQAMYWLADGYFKSRDYVKAYQTFKKLTWDYPANKWAKVARGRLTEEELSRFEEEGL